MSIVCPYCGMSTWLGDHCALPGCKGASVEQVLADVADEAEQQRDAENDDGLPALYRVSCPRCGAGSGLPCVMSTGRTTAPHDERVALYEAQQLDAIGPS